MLLLVLMAGIACGKEGLRMKLEHFGMAEPGDCRLVFTAGAEELAAAVAQAAGGAGRAGRKRTVC